MKIQLFHFTRIPGCSKSNKNKGKKWSQTSTWATYHQDLEFYLHHYQYLEEPRKIHRKTLVILILCNNCNEHKINPELCELILDSKNRVHGISFKIAKSDRTENYYIAKNDYLHLILRYFVYQWQPTCNTLLIVTFIQNSILNTGGHLPKQQNICLFFAPLPKLK